MLREPKLLFGLRSIGRTNGPVYCLGEARAYSSVSSLLSRRIRSTVSGGGSTNFGATFNRRTRNFLGVTCTVRVALPAPWP